MVASNLQLLQIQSASEFIEPIDPGLERSEITNHSPSEITGISFTQLPILDDDDCMREQLHLDHPPVQPVTSSDNLESTPLLHVPIRLAHFERILRHPDLQHSYALLTPLANFSCVSPVIHNGNRDYLEGRTTQSQELAAILADIVLECAFCDASFSPANIFAFDSNNGNAKLTMKLLESLAAEHAEGCRGRKGVALLNADDTQFGVCEGAS